MTRTEYLECHKYMWDKIVKQIIETNKIVDVINLKKQVLNNLHMAVSNDCFLCGQSSQEDPDRMCDCNNCAFNIKNNIPLEKRKPAKCCSNIWKKVVSPMSKEHQLRYAMAIRDLRYVM